jgi:lipopolysaccharide export LptBFGC system permease protein LptF
LPEGPEIETERLHEAIHEEMEREGGTFIRAIAVTTALLAAIAAVAALRAGGSANEALMLETEATRLQARASDQWAYYQAKGIKAAVQEASRTSWLSLGKEPPAKYAEAQARYAREQAGISASAKEIERERDTKAAEAEHLLHQHHRYANSVALFQVAIALGAIAALSRNRGIWFASLTIGFSGTVLFVITLLGH